MNNGFVPEKVFFTSGVGRHQEKLTSFEMALRDAGIEKFNLVKVSSIFPPECEIVEREEGLEHLQPGQIVFCVLSENSSNEPSRRVSASIGCAIPRDRSLYGYLSEHHSYGESAKKAGDYAEDLAAYMLATTLGIEADEKVEWDRNREVWLLHDRIVKTQNITASAVVSDEGEWSTAVACAVFVL